MVEVTEADRQLSALIIKCSEVEHGAKLIATHREAAAKAVTDRLRDLPDEIALDVYERLPAEIDSIDAADVGLIAAALADALESQP